ncbi:hypothetical protein [Streptomyces sp. NPDC048349]|uniref:hypothetical protein n=1 Tax=Streptomyces sp. NPDC048349 TaxID=3155486 RepID=UPI0034346DCC
MLIGIEHGDKHDFGGELGEVVDVPAGQVKGERSVASSTRKECYRQPREFWGHMIEG